MKRNPTARLRKEVPIAASQQRLGRQAEEAAATWLSSRGWRVLARRWRSASGEIDLVCLDPDGALVGVEVKLRRSTRTGGPEDALDARRLIRLRRTLADYATQRRTPVTTLRIDLVSLTPAGAAWRVARWPGVDQW
ncbi:MAG TPA: YraN family protein [Candidatus Limnocylindria bacterium]|nr:YraN family protein [Candidatus Limnocylindria bacterium]